jgi:hypothetical protein
MTSRAHPPSPLASAGRAPPPVVVVEDPGALLDRLERAIREGARFLGEADAAALDALAVALARGGAHELAIGEGLDLLARTGGDVRLGYSGAGDLAVQRLGLPADQSRRLRRDAAKLRARPLLRAAVLRGEVTLRKAEVVLPVAVGPAEAYWVARASADTVRRLVRERAAEDELLGRACLLVRRTGAFRWFAFASFDAYCAERLGLAPSTVRQRIALERRLQVLPELREALRTGSLSYEQARLVARVATPADVAQRIAAAAAKTCVAYRREVQAEQDRQMWRAGQLRAVVPDEVDDLVADALRAARASARGGITPGEALVALALHFVLTWKEEVRRLLRATDDVVLRDGGLCAVPGCSRPADHVHHVEFRSAGGPLEPWNETSACGIHHLRGIHAGNVLVDGRAPDGLRFVLGEREVRAARERRET